jgi:N-acetylglucosaminyldiphosphoundecaprenol N-acetyl-beta-D-mannosaminyltransferase
MSRPSQTTKQRNNGPESLLNLPPDTPLSIFLPKGDETNMQAVKRVDILGCPFDAISFAETVATIRRAVLNKTRLRVVPGSIDFVMKARGNPAFAEELWRSDLVVADGKPIVWAARLLGDAICGRVSGTELVWKCAEISHQVGCAIALVGGAPGVAQRAAAKMQGRYPQATPHAIPTPFPLNSQNNATLVESIRATRASIVLVALGAPRQERWIQANLDPCGANVGIGVGSAFDIICGDKPRAPQWMQDAGLEWLHRLRFEPGRLGRRYLIEDSPFVFHLVVEVIRRRLHRGGTCLPANLRH